MYNSIDPRNSFSTLSRLNVLRIQILLTQGMILRITSAKSTIKNEILDTGVDDNKPNAK